MLCCANINNNSNALDTIKYLCDIIEVDLYATDNIGYNCLHYACNSGSLSIIKYLVEQHNMLIDGKTDQGCTILHIACINGYMPIIEYCIEYLLYDINIPDNNNWSVLHYAVHYNNIKLIDYLINNKANIYSIAHEGWSLLHIACRSEYCTTQTIELLDQYNINVHLLDNTNATCLTLACIKYNVVIVEYLLDSYIWSKEHIIHSVVCVMYKFNNDINLVKQNKSALLVLNELKSTLDELNDNNNNTNNNDNSSIDTNKYNSSTAFLYTINEYFNNDNTSNYSIDILKQNVVTPRSRKSITIKKS